MERPGFVVLFGSGEISPSGQKVYHWLFETLNDPIRMAILETPAGFQPNSAWVAQQIADFVEKRLQNFAPQIQGVPARQRGTPFSPEEPAILEPLLSANVMFMGPGSPTYAVRQLRDSLAWHILTASHRLGASLVLASAATLAVSAYTLPVYEIYKVGDEPHWQPGLDLFGPYGLSLAFVPHWNNQDGGANLDTSHCYMGRERFAVLLDRLPADVTVVGIDEHTALALDLGTGRCHVLGRGGVTLLNENEQQRFEPSQDFTSAELGPFRPPDPAAGVPDQVWQQVRRAKEESQAPPQPSVQVLQLVLERQAARERRDWAAADRLREQIDQLGWQVRDTADGPDLVPNL